jgi:tetratricopeptide (TPR) repeat protein
MAAETAEECVEVLLSVAQGDGAASEVLEALVIVALAHPKLAKRLELDPVGTGRRLATAYERDGSPEHGLAVLELLQQHFPGQPTVERELAQTMRRQGMVKDLVGRYFERARKLAREGRHGEAAGWLREILQLDPGRKDAARMLRDLRFKRPARPARQGASIRTLFLLVALALGVAYLGLRELRLHGQFLALPETTEGNRERLRLRLEALEAFIAANPLWHGALRALSERTDLRLRLALIEERERVEREDAARAARERIEAAELCRARGLMEAQSGDPRRALESLREALSYGGPEWSAFEQVSRDVSALEQGLSENP